MLVLRLAALHLAALHLAARLIATLCGRAVKRRVARQRRTRREREHCKASRNLPHLFEKYFRASGRIWVDSSVGRGTTFYVALPTALPEEQRRAPSASSA